MSEDMSPILDFRIKGNKLVVVLDIDVMTEERVYRLLDSIKFVTIYERAMSRAEKTVGKT